MPNIKILDRDIETSLYIFSLAISFISIGGFGIYRIIKGDLTLASIDLSVSIFLAYTLKQVLCNTFTNRHKFLIIVICMIGVAAVLYNKGSSEIYWAYPPITAAFFFIDLRKALPLNIVFIAIVLAILIPEITLPQFFSISVTLILICAFGYTFSARTELHGNECIKLAEIDPLTGLNNRRSLTDRLKKEISYYQNNIQRSSLLILDIDHFKKINDTYGHNFGDRILVKFAKTLKKTVRETDKVYRYGGEEFIIVTCNTRLFNAARLGEYIRQLTEQTLIVENKPITVSIGVAEVRKDDTHETWLHRADHALYRAKGANRNQVYLAHGDKNSCTYKPYVRTIKNKQLEREAMLQ